MLEESMDDFDFVPDTPRPVLQKKRIKSDTSQEPRYDRVLKDNNFAIEKDTESSGLKDCKVHLSLPGQNRFAMEREEAVRRKKEREHLSPFKSKPSVSSSKTKINPSLTEAKTNFLTDFVKSSELLREKSGNLVVKSGNGHKVCPQRKSETSEAYQLSRKKSKQRKIRPTQFIRWPSSSDTSSDEEDLLTKSRSACYKCKKPSSAAAVTTCKTCGEDSVVNRNDVANQETKRRKLLKEKALEQFTGTKSSTISRCPDSKTVAESTSSKKSSKGSNKTELPLLAPWHNYMAEEVIGASSTAGGSAGQRKSPFLSLSALIDSKPTNVPSMAANIQLSLASDSDTDDDLSRSSSSSVFSLQRQRLNDTRGRMAEMLPIRATKRSEDNAQPDRSTPTADIICISPDDVLSNMGSQQCPIDVEMLTPETRRAVTHIQQVQTDEEMARKLQEELDMEFAMSLQNLSQNISPARGGPPELPEDSERFYSPRLHMYTPPRTRRQGRGSGIAQRSSRMPGEMALSGAEGFDAGRRRHGQGVHMGFMGGMMISPSGSGNDYEYLMDLSERIGDAVPKGLSKSQTNQLPVITYKKQEDKTEECNICMTEYEDGDSQKILPCFHTYHEKCINKWIVKNATCPVCRVPVKLD